MIGLFIIAFLAPLAVFGPFALFIRRLAARRPSLVEDAARTQTLFVWLPLAVCYGLISLIAALAFVDYIKTQ